MNKYDTHMCVTDVCQMLGQGYACSSALPFSRVVIFGMEGYLISYIVAMVPARSGGLIAFKLDRKNLTS